MLHGDTSQRVLEMPCGTATRSLLTIISPFKLNSTYFLFCHGYLFTGAKLYERSSQFLYKGEQQKEQYSQDVCSSWDYLIKQQIKYSTVISMHNEIMFSVRMFSVRGRSSLNSLLSASLFLFCSKLCSANLSNDELAITFNAALRCVHTDS